MFNAKSALAKTLVIATALAAFAPSMAKAAEFDTVVLSATVAESVTFTIDESTLSFGTLSATDDRYANNTTGSSSEVAGSTANLSTNGTNGVGVVVTGDTLTSGGDTISNITTGGGATSSLGSEQFGIAFDGATGFTIGSGYDQDAPKYKFVSGDTVLSSLAPASDSSINMYYLANIAGLTEAGSYSTTLTFTATGSF